MKRHIKGANMNVMLGLLAVLFISLGYLSMQNREGMEAGPKAGSMTKTSAKSDADCKTAGGKWDPITMKCT